MMIDILKDLPPDPEEKEFLYQAVIDTPAEMIDKIITNNGSAKEIEEVIVNYHRDLFSFDKQYQLHMFKFDQNPVFMTALESATNFMVFDPLEVLTINGLLAKIVQNNKDSVALKIGKTINKVRYESLRDEVSETNAIMLAIFRGAAWNSYSVVEYVNKHLVRECKEISNLQAMERVFEILYKDLSFSVVFDSVIFDYPQFLVMGLSKDEQKRLELLNTTTLLIVELAMSSSEIYKMLNNLVANIQVNSETPKLIKSVEDLAKYPRLQQIWIQVGLR